MTIIGVITVMCLAAFVPLADAAITIVTGRMNNMPGNAVSLLKWRGMGYILLCPIAYAAVILHNGFFANFDITKDYALLAMATWAACGSIALIIGMSLKSQRR